jgi:nucleoside-diphosphate-sugar epimerase
VAYRARVLVAGAGGFIGHHLTRLLVARGYWVRGVDLAVPAFERTRAHAFEQLDLRRWEACLDAARGVDEVYQLAAQGAAGGAARAAAVLHDNALIDTHLLEAARLAGARRYLYASSAEAENGAGSQKLFGELLCRRYREDHGLETRVARLAAVFGPLGPFEGGAASVPAALCRAVALAAENDELELGDDERAEGAHCYVDDCAEGLHRLMRSEWREPLDLLPERAARFGELVELVARAAGKPVKLRGEPALRLRAPGRRGDSALLRRALAWLPSTSLERGLELSYRWIHGQLRARRSV